MQPTGNMYKKLPNDSRQICMELKNKIITGKTKFLSAEEVIGLTSGAKTCVSPVKVVHSNSVIRKNATPACKGTIVKSNDIPSMSSKPLAKPNPPLTPPPLKHFNPPMAQPVPLSFKGLKGTNLNDVPPENLMNDQNQADSTNHTQKSKVSHQTPCKEKRQKEQPTDMQEDTAKIKSEKEKYVPKVEAASVMHCHEIVISGTNVNDVPLEDLMHGHNQATLSNHMQRPKDSHQKFCVEQPKGVQGDTVEIKLEKEENVQEAAAASVMHCQEIVVSGSGAFHDLEIERTITSVNSFVDPSSEASWNGIFKVLTSEIGDISDEIEAHPPCRVRKKVYELTKLMPDILQFELVPRMDLWEDLSQHLYLDKRDIGLYLFPTDIERWEQYLKLLKHMEAKDFIMRTIVDSLELLVFPSTLLSTDCQEWNARCFLWGVFKKIKPCHAIPINALDMNNDEVDMDIDMIGGIDVGTTDIVTATELFNSTPPDMSEDMEIDLIGEEAVGKTDIVIPKEFMHVTTVARITDIPPGYENKRWKM
ncbi:OLC1v1012185C1 [Oldenlandia corymbosa var. corymbosa]|nr:OLC1v1012185C1 [Oldenlandia corymbosa var. corymbosa]